MKKKQETHGKDMLGRPAPVGYTVELPDYGDLMTVREWLDCVESRSFIDYDGFCHPAKDGKMSVQCIYPSQAEELPQDATHVVWFNR